MKRRDYVHEMRLLIDTATAHHTYIPALVAHDLVEKLRADDPELLTGWLNQQAEYMIRTAINDRDRSMRGRARHHASRSVFAAAVDQYEHGNKGALEPWLNAPFSVGHNMRMRLREMTREDLEYAGQSYQVRADQNQYTATFLKVLAEKVGGASTVEQVFTESQLDELYSTIAKRND